MSIQKPTFYMVGGAVRDLYLGRIPKDHDYVLVGGSEQYMFDLGYTKIGESFPVFLHPTEDIEVALARTESKQGFKHVDFTVETQNITLEQDSGRRDFRCNAMAIEVNNNLELPDNFTIIDPFGGRKDLDDHILRCVNPEAFVEDPLRVIRAIRFADRYDLMLDDELFTLCLKMVREGQLNHLSVYRFVKELKRVAVTCVEDTKSLFGFFNNCLKLELFKHVHFFKMFDEESVELYCEDYKSQMVTKAKFKFCEDEAFEDGIGFSEEELFGIAFGQFIKTQFLYTEMDVFLKETNKINLKNFSPEELLDFILMNVRDNKKMLMMLCAYHEVLPKITYRDLPSKYYYKVFVKLNAQMKAITKILLDSGLEGKQLGDVLSQLKKNQMTLLLSLES